jgi:hypothetical protein
MVTDDLGGGSTEDPLPRRFDGASFSAVFPAADLQPSSPSAEMNSTGEKLSGPDAGDPSTTRVPLWNRLPRSIWLMSALALAIAS